MRSRITATAMLGTALLALAGCADAERPDSPLAPSVSPSLSVSEGQSAERTALNELTRAVALALQDPGLRQRIKNDMRASRHTVEHKLEFRSYLRGESGGILLVKMAKETGKSREDLLALVNAVRPLEFYMPVPEHRESWRGDANLLVASLLKDHTVPTAYTLQGDPVMLHAEVAPATPTLAIVPVETNFSRPLDAKVPNKKDQGGQTIGTYCLECVEQPIIDDGSGGGGGTQPRGYYYLAADMIGVGEAYLKGYPEIEVHQLHAYDPDRDKFGPSTDARSTCDAGERHSGYRYFNQDHERWSGRALLLDSAELETYATNQPENPYRVASFTLWEDDIDPCELRTNIDVTGVLTIAGFGAAAVLRSASSSGSLEARLLVAGIASVLWVIPGSYYGFSTNDDFLGVAKRRENVENPGYEGYSHILIIDPSTNKRNGAVTLDFR